MSGEPWSEPRDGQEEHDLEIKYQAEHIRALESVVSEFLNDKRVCLAIAQDCVGGHQEDPCKCLYCRAKKALGDG